MVGAYGLDRWPDPFENIPKLGPLSAKAQINNSRVRKAIEPDNPTNVAIEAHKNTFVGATLIHKIRVGFTGRSGRHLNHIVALLSQPQNNRPIDIFIGENAHHHAAEDRGTSTTSSVASDSDAYAWHA